MQSIFFSDTSTQNLWKRTISKHGENLSYFFPLIESTLWENLEINEFKLLVNTVRYNLCIWISESGGAIMHPNFQP